MKVLLVQSPAGRVEPPVFPLGLAFLAGQLDGCDVSALDLATGSGPGSTLRDALESRKPDVVALSLRNIDDSSYPVTWSYLAPFDAVVGALGNWKGTVIAGGPGFTINAEQMMQRYPRIDAGVAGEGEEVLPELLGEHEAISGSRRLVRPPAPDLASIAPPDYSILPLAPYERHFGIGVQSRRGCSFGCSYCTYAFLGGRTFRCRPVAAVTGDVERIGALGARRFQFVDSVFDAPREYSRRLVEDLAGCGLEWGAWLDQSVEPGDLAAMARSGCVKVDFSPDAITARGMRKLGKRGDFASLVRAARGARRVGMSIGINFFNGNPGEGLGALLGKFAFMAAARLFLGVRRTSVNIGTIRVYRGSRLASEMVRDGLVESDCNFLEPVFLPARGAADLLFRWFQAVRRIRHG